jgi:hypothetical protein
MANVVSVAACRNAGILCANGVGSSNLLRRPDESGQSRI